MKFTVEHETSSSMRIRMAGDKPSKRTGDAICAILSRTAGIQKVRIYPATKGLMIRHSLGRDALMGILEELDPETIREVKQELKAGERVIITSGPFKGWEGIVERRADNNLVWIRVETIGFSMAMEIAAADCEIA